MKRFFAFSLIVVFAIAAFLFLAKNSIARFALTKSVKQAAGLDINIEKIDMGLLNHYVNVNNLVMFNPPGFEEKDMAVVPQIYINYDLISFFKGKAHIPKLRLELKDFVVIKNSKGRLNINSISGVFGPKEEKDIKKQNVKIDILELKVGSVTYKDYTQQPAAIWRYNVNIDEKYYNITDFKALTQLIINRALINTAISRLADFDLADIMGSVDSMLKSGKGAVKDAITGLLNNAF